MSMGACKRHSLARSHARTDGLRGIGGGTSAVVRWSRRAIVSASSHASGNGVVAIAQGLWIASLYRKSTGRTAAPGADAALEGAAWAAM